MSERALPDKLWELAALNNVSTSQSSLPAELKPKTKQQKEKHQTIIIFAALEDGEAKFYSI